MHIFKQITLFLVLFCVVRSSYSMELGCMGDSPLYKAAVLGLDKEVKDLVLNGQDVNVQNPFQYTPLHLAARHGQVQVVKVLMDLGADLSLKCYHDKTSLRLAAKKGHVDVVAALLHYPFCAVRARKDAKARIHTALCIFNRLQPCLPQDVRKKILFYLPEEDVLSQEHTRLLLNHKADLDVKKLVKVCPVTWLVNIYRSTDCAHRDSFLPILTTIIENRFAKTKEMLEDRSLRSLDPQRLTPAINALLATNNLEQRRVAIEQQVMDLFNGQEQ